MRTSLFAFGASPLGEPLGPGLRLRAGQIFAGRYRLIERVASGASTVTVAARQSLTREDVTLTLLMAFTDDQEEAALRQLGKAQLASRLTGEHATRVLDAGVADDLPFIATPRLAGRTLAAELAERGPLPVAEAVRWILEACAGLAEAHALGMVHGALDLTKVLLEGEAVGGSGARRARVLDFGLSNPIEASGDASATAWLAMPSCLAPEQVQTPDAVDARADIWALGAMLHELVNGERPFRGETVSGVFVALCRDEPSPLREDVPPELARVLRRCMAKDPDARPQTVVSLAKRLSRFAGDEGPALLAKVRAYRDRGAAIAAEEPGDGRDEAAADSMREPFFPAAASAPAEPAPMATAARAARGGRRGASRARVMPAAFVALLVGIGVTTLALGARAPASAITAAPIEPDEPASVTELSGARLDLPLDGDAPEAADEPLEALRTEPTAPPPSSEAVASTSAPTVSSKSRPVRGARAGHNANANANAKANAKGGRSTTDARAREAERLFGRRK